MHRADGVGDMIICQGEDDDTEAFPATRWRSEWKSWLFVTAERTPSRGVVDLSLVVTVMGEETC